ncbi:MAG: phasin family protein [Stagnimonas sp.]|nr:phasin family protein [Stagnimonas sp.]
MTATARKRPAAREAAPATFAPLGILADLGRQQMCVAAEASSAMLRGFETMRRIQQEAAHAASERHEAVAAKLHGSSTPADLMAMQAGLLQADWQSASRYWQDLAGTALEMQVEMMGCASHLMDSEAALESVSAVEAFDAWPGMKALLPFPRAS